MGISEPILLLVFLFCCWGIFHRNSSVLYPTHSHGSRSRNRIALTFDDGPSPLLTPVVLDVLKAGGVPATFFCVGNLVEKYPEIVQRMHQEGHLVAAHSYEHSWRLFAWGPNRVERSIRKTRDAIARVTGLLPRFYRAPVGFKTPPQAIAAWRLSLEFVGWTRWCGDGGRQRLTRARADRLIRRARNGDILLLHDGKLDLSGREIATEAHLSAIRESLPETIRGLRARGLEAIRLDQLLGVSGGSPDPAQPEQPRSLFRTLARTLVREHSEPSRLSLALGAGILIGCSPFLGLHALLGLMAAARFRLNKLAVLAGTNISSPITGPVVIFAAIQVGWRILNGSWLTSSFGHLTQQSPISLADRFLASWLAGFPVVGLTLALLLGSLTYVLLSLRKKA